MRVRAQAYRLPKAGNAWDEYEDACWPADAVDEETDRSSYAVADGATETSFSGIWARLLVEAYGSGSVARRGLPRSLPRLQQQWRVLVGDRPLPWYAQQKLQSGAFSSLLGLTIYEPPARPPDRSLWKTTGVGDSNLFQVRDDHLAVAFPIARSQDFNSRPHLLSTDPGRNASLAAHTRFHHGRAAPGDVFYLMTDAIACWFLLEVERGGKPWRDFDDILASPDAQTIDAWIAERRRSGDLRNDDVTVLRVEVA